MQDQFLEDMYELYLNEYAHSYPYNMEIRKDIFFAKIKEILQTKGSVASIQQFFRIIFNVDVEVQFPQNRRLTHTSRSTYTIRSFADTLPQREMMSRLVGNYIAGDRGAAGLVQAVTFQEQYGRYIATIELENILNSYFVMGETINFKFSLTEEITFEVGGIIANYRIINAGTGYRVGDPVIPVYGSEFLSALIVVRSIGPVGEILELDIKNPGFLYNSTVSCYLGAASGTGAEIELIGGAYSTWNAQRVSPTIVYSQGNKVISGSDDVSNDYVEFGYADISDGGYFYDTSGSHNPLDYNPSFVIGRDSRSFGKVYFEIQIDRVSQDALGNDVVEDLNGSDIVLGLCNDPQFSGVPGTTANSWGFNILANSNPFKHNNIQVNDKSFARVDNDNLVVVRFAVDFLENKVYIGCRQGWFGTPNSNNLTTQPIYPIFENVNYTEGLFVCASGRFTPYVNLIAALQYGDLECKPLPEYLGAEESTSGDPSGIVNDHDPYTLKVLTWDDASSTFNSNRDIYQSAGGDVTFRYKIFSPLPSIMWSKLYRACIHPVGMEYNVDISNVAYSVDANGLKIRNTFTEPVIIHGNSADYDIKARGNNTFNDVFNSQGKTLKEFETYRFDQDVTVNAIEVALNDTTILSGEIFPYWVPDYEYIEPTLQFWHSE